MPGASDCDFLTERCDPYRLAALTARFQVRGIPNIAVLSGGRTIYRRLVGMNRWTTNLGVHIRHRRSGVSLS